MRRVERAGAGGAKRPRRPASGGGPRRGRDERKGRARRAGGGARPETAADPPRDQGADAGGAGDRRADASGRSRRGRDAGRPLPRRALPAARLHPHPEDRPQGRASGRRQAGETAERLEAGQKIRIPPLRLEPQKVAARSAARDQDERGFLKSIALYEDKDVLILNKPAGLAVQGGPGTKRHVDGLLEALRDEEGQKPRLVHRLDKDTAGCLIVAKTRFAAVALGKTFRSRAARKIYWAVVAGVPRVRQGRVSTYLAKEEIGDKDARMRVAEHGDEGASHALTYYAVVETAAQKLAWLSLKPVTGRTHQLRAHAAHIGHPIVGDPKYFNVENWELPGGLQNKLHLLARRIVIPHPRTGRPIDVTAPLPPHMEQSFNLLGFDAARYDPIVEAPED